MNVPRVVDPHHTIRRYQEDVQDVRKAIEALEGNSCRVGRVLSEYASLRKEMDFFARAPTDGWKQEWKEASISACAMQRLLEMWHSDVKYLWVLSYALTYFARRTSGRGRELQTRRRRVLHGNSSVVMDQWCWQTVFHTFASRTQPLVRIWQGVKNNSGSIWRWVKNWQRMSSCIHLQRSDIHQLTWWKHVAPSVREVSDLSIRLLSMRATSACSERNWKSFTAHCVKSRPRLSVTTGEKEVRIYGNELTNYEEISDFERQRWMGSTHVWHRSIHDNTCKNHSIQIHIHMKVRNV